MRGKARYRRSYKRDIVSSAAVYNVAAVLHCGCSREDESVSETREKLFPREVMLRPDRAV